MVIEEKRVLRDLEEIHKKIDTILLKLNKNKNKKKVEKG